MSRHLNPHEIVDALEGVLALKRQAHVDACATCARELSSLREVRRDAAASVDDSEPSPLFWTHFSDRVREATRHDEAPTPRWIPIWQPLTGVGVIAVLAAILVGMPRQESSVPEGSPPAAVSSQAEMTVAAEDDTWTFVLDVASELPVDEVQELARPRPGTADALIENLSAEQRSEFVRLLKAEMGTLE